jgi:dTDP-4-dehydrorhamnose reductase
MEFDVLVNAAAYSAVDACESNAELAFHLNANAPGVIARICADKRARMIHFSTDYVFDGTKSEPYTENDPPNPTSVYAESKLAGEEKVLSASARHLIVRVSWLFGPGRPAFPEWVIGQAQQKDRVAIVSDKISSPTYAVDVAIWLSLLLRMDVSSGGLLHLCNGGECAWNEYGAFVLDCASAAGVPLRGATVDPIPMSSVVGFSARRPPYSALDTSRFQKLTGVTPRPWKEAIGEHLTRTVSRRRGSDRAALETPARNPVGRRSEHSGS